MTPEEVTGAVADLLGRPATVAHATAAVDVPREEWVAAVGAVRDRLDLTLFDVLTAVDEEPHGVEVVLRLWSPAGRHGLVLRTRCPPTDLRVASLTGLFGGAAWHERSVHEMFGVDFDGHPDLRPLLLPAGFGAHPLRKDFVLASRTVRPWPGSVEPGQSAEQAAAAAATPRGARRRLRPPGVPDPAAWPAP